MNLERSKVITEEIRQMFRRNARSRMSIDAVCNYVERYSGKSALYRTETFKKDTRPSLRLLNSVQPVSRKTRSLFTKTKYRDVA